MATDIKMPRLGESVTEGTVGRWLKQCGEPVAKYEPLLEVVTDKVDSEVPAPVAGTLLEILVPEGTTVQVGTVLARIGDVVATNNALPHPAAPVPGTFQPPTIVAAGPRSNVISPVVARLVAEYHVDITQLRGTGAGGRVSRQDVLHYLEQRGNEAPVPASAASVAPVQVPVSTAERAFPPPRNDTTEGGASPVLASTEADELIPLSPMRRSIAEHMLRSVRTAPHVTAVMEVDVSAIVAHREANQAAFARQGVKLTFTPYFVHAIARALQAVPLLNSSYSDEGLIQHRRIHIGVAVAFDEGLLVPVIRDADEKNLLGLARAVSDLTERARTRRLKPDETQGGTFTITNHGVGGSLFATPIINQPQAGILGIGAIQKRPVVVTYNGVDAIAIKSMCYLSLTFDHRVADGAAGDALLRQLQQVLEAFS